MGKWSRIATYGPKKQQRPDGGWYDTIVFDDAKFEASLRNFRIMFAARGKGMGSDCEHQTLYAPANGQPAKNPAYFTALAWVKDGKVRGFEPLRDGISPIDPQAEAAKLKELYPKAADHSPDGVWAYCAEVTEYGVQVIPSYAQLSPLFNEEEYDEAGKLLGFAWLNVSFVNVAHQTGTNYAFGKVIRMADISHDDMMKKLGHHGLGEQPKADDYEKALSAYMAATDDPKEMRAAMAQACRKAMGELEIVHHEDEDEDEDLTQEEMEKKLAGHGLGEEPAPEMYKKALAAYLTTTDDPKQTRAAMAKACAKAMSLSADKRGMGAVVDSMSRKLSEQEKERKAMAKKVADLQKEKEERELADVIVDAESRSLTADEAREFYKTFGKAGALTWLKKFPKKTGAMGKWPIGGEPRSVEGSTIETVNGVKVIGRGLSKLAGEILKKGEASNIKDAQILAAKRAPHLYSSGENS